jgi:hypothetical protein
MRSLRRCGRLRSKKKTALHHREKSENKTPPPVQAKLWMTKKLQKQKLILFLNQDISKK